ncbi:hypothetical protein GCM10007382_08920 [Salinibacterium xinjiangense]|uniref:Cysteine-rich secretory protein family protein n=1 Tax=Salinibacterium xinjiangense TaxID=386302 RepID=A0A2C8Z9U1_9MICO|nr:hypothetical protein [Salinibacterium xinjiangense]GGK90991.1 hypothetical protein GCM10007382_08920 [Salinibacterium xinjiangense]SOE60719.1 hypothetical protein SAMN06296378_1139 [Salinibacterium xinjiangense]
MKKSAFLSSAATVVLLLIAPLIGGAGPGLNMSVVADVGTTAPPLAIRPVAASIAAAPRIAIATTTRVAPEPAVVNTAASVGVTSQSWANLVHKSVPKSVPLIVGSGAVNTGAAGAPQAPGCPAAAGGSVGSAPGVTSAGGVAGTTSNDLASFAFQYNAIRMANCLEPISYSNFRYDSCMEARLFWMAESPSPDPLDAWGHIGSVRIDGVPSTGCDGNLAGGSGNTGATVAQKWWDSTSHRASLYRPGSSIGGACIAFAMSHGGIDEPASFVRAAARWTTC